VISGSVSALLLSGAVGFARSRTSGSPTSQPCSRQYTHAVRTAARRTLNVDAAFSPHTNVNQPATRSSFSNATFASLPKSRSIRFSTTA
jgi:hypothetical protein